jgi:hypothetical protein
MDMIRVIPSKRRVEARRAAEEAETAEIRAWMHRLIAFMDAPKGYAGGLVDEPATVVITDTAANVDRIYVVA